MFWPKLDLQQGAAKQKIVPSTATSDKWLEFYEKKEKEEKILAIAKRKEERLKRKRDKEEMNKQKIKNKTKKKTKSVQKKKKSEEPEADLSDSLSNQSSWYCNICESEVEKAMIQCTKCHEWYHEDCANVEKNQKKFVCC